ncbi:MAG: T9SS type A sorting domain-containing protein, partial [Winogradskyella sp.]|nr:T9SS type A sorting domain-containing protein [Winogradskyella sp.]
ENGIHINNLNSGVYIVSIALDNNQTMEKKIIIN